MTAFIPVLLVKLTLIFAAGLTVAAILRSSSPSLRHIILFATLASGLLLPLVMLLSPQWNVALLPASPASIIKPSQPISEPLGGVSSEGTINEGLRRSPSLMSEAGRNTAMLALVWAFGFITVFGWLAIGRFRLRRFAAEAWPLDGPAWSGILNEERSYAGVSKPVLLLSSSIVSTPLTWGWRAPVVLLPEDAIDWPEPHRRIVLRHELAHIARGDSLNQLIAGLACAVYWFHPLAWITERRLRAECERACDDSVVSLGTPAAEYAAHLLEVARSARAFGAPGFLSIAMARPSQLEGRLLAVLSESRRRVSLSRGARPVAALLSALILIPLAAFRAVPKVHERSSGKLASSAPIESTESVKAAAFPASPAVAPAIPARQTATQPKTPSAPRTLAAADTTLQLAVPARSGEALSLNLKTGGAINIIGWDKPEVSVRASLGGRDWRETAVRLLPSDAGARLETDFTTTGNSRSTRHSFEIKVPRRYDVRIHSSGGSITIAGLDGVFVGNTGGGEIDIRKSSGEVDIRTGGGDIHVSDSRLNGKVETGGGRVTIERVAGDLEGRSGGGRIIYSKSGASAGTSDRDVMIVGAETNNISSTGSGTGEGGTRTSYTYSSGGKVTGGAARVRMSTGGGAISLPSAPEGAHVTTGGGKIEIGPSGGSVYARTGGGSIEIGPATGSVEAHTGAGNVTIKLKGTGSHSVDVSSGKGEVVLLLPSGLDATLELETAYTNNLGHKTRIVSDWALQQTETDSWDGREGTPRRYVRARQTVGKGGAVIRVRTVNGDIVLKRGG
jgi:beta-lactamase regulating signal transducer with metallopeptidase domain